MGTFHSASRKHLPNYLNECEFRWNTRKLDDGARLARAIKSAGSVNIGGVWSSTVITTVSRDVVMPSETASSMTLAPWTIRRIRRGRRVRQTHRLGMRAKLGLRPMTENARAVPSRSDLLNGCVEMCVQPFEGFLNPFPCDSGAFAQFDGPADEFAGLVVHWVQSTPERLGSGCSIFQQLLTSV